MIQRPLIERPLIAERVVETGARDPRFLDEIANGRCFVAARPKALRSSVKHRLFVKFSWPCHPFIHACDQSAVLQSLRRSTGRKLSAKDLLQNIEVSFRGGEACIASD